jgi:hypothetical protein
VEVYSPLLQASQYVTHSPPPILNSRITASLERHVSGTPGNSQDQQSLSSGSACLCNSKLSPVLKPNDTRKYKEAHKNNLVKQAQKLNKRKPYKRKKLPKLNERTITQENVLNTKSHVQAKAHQHKFETGLQCYSCGSLLNPDASCQFNRSDASQVQTCSPGEACLMYTWRQSQDKAAILRECFSTSVLLGSISDPLVPSSHCDKRDITDNGDGSILACLCDTDYCNDQEDTGESKQQTPTTWKESQTQIITTTTPAPLYTNNRPEHQSMSLPSDTRKIQRSKNV